MDALVIKDRNDLPYIPGKTVKGLIKEAVDELKALASSEKKFEPDADYLATFGYFDDKDRKEKSEAFFSNAEIPENEAEKIVEGKLQRFMYDSLSHTAIETNGVARAHSLRKVQVTVPCDLMGQILNVPEGMVEILEKGMKYTKCLGLNRNRGLGRCTITIVKKEGRK